MNRAVELPAQTVIQCQILRGAERILKKQTHRVEREIGRLRKELLELLRGGIDVRGSADSAEAPGQERIERLEIVDVGGVRRVDVRVAYGGIENIIDRIVGPHSEAVT